ncbi:MAG: isochorismatase family protein [Candidatus Marinimicrobia bacterium]|nr:isochorismatase family protein [Candidatus Neomarinimicrobiota bacterium]
MRNLSIILILLFTIGVTSAADKAEPMKPALLVIDIQNVYLDWMSQEDQDRVFQYINASIKIFRDAGLPIIRVYNTDPDYGPPQGTEEFEFTEKVPMLPDDPMVIKNYANGFKKTDLQKFLKKNDVNTLFLCGLSATGCVLATYHGAKDLDYETFMIKNALLSPKVNYTKSVEEIFDAMPYSALRLLINNMN